jgi:hypothetical protein
MNPLKGFREDLVDYIGRLREQVYPDLTNTDVAVILRQIAQSFHRTNSQAKAQARDELVREAAARGVTVPAVEDTRDWGQVGQEPLTRDDVADMKRQLEERLAKAGREMRRELERPRSVSPQKAMAAERAFYRELWAERDLETQFAADRCAGESLPIGRDL